MFFMQSASAADASIGCIPYNLTVKTGQTFYITVAVTDTIDLYAWQINARYYPEYLEFVGIVSGDHLRSDGALGYSVAPVIVPNISINDMQLAAYTRLGKDAGINGSGEIAYILFRAVKQKLNGSTITLHDIVLVDRNALEISKSTANSGQCKITISDTAPPIGPRLYLPTIRQ
jgi:hypothetical protein